MSQPQQVTVKSTGPMADMKRKKLMESINGLTDTELKNLETLLNSPKARAKIGNDFKFALLKAFI